MAFVPVQTKLLLEDVPKESRDWMTKLIAPLNQFISSTIAAMTKDLSFAENIRCQIKSITFVNNEASFPLTFKCTLKARPIAVLKLNVIDVSETRMDFTGIAIDIPDWTYTQTQEIQINHVSGLNPDQKYKLSILVL